MVGSIAVLLLFQLAGEVISRVLSLPLPGPVLGMLLLLAALMLRGTAPLPLRDTCRGLLSHLSLLFVPAGVGIIAHLHRIAEQWLALGVTLILSTAITVAATAGTMAVLTRRRAGED
ncbi:MAG: CidA/LrgA family protein [Ectothiorhodospiraceae bacterium]|jgi:holin-like protein